MRISDWSSDVCSSDLRESFMRLFRPLVLRAALGISPALASEAFWVTADRLNARTCPSTECGVVSQKFFREAVTIYERRDGWARITGYYDAACVGGVSEYVDEGTAFCMTRSEEH